MKLSISQRFLALLLAVALTFGLSFTLVSADHPEGEHIEMHDNEMSHDEHGDDVDTRIEQMKQIVALLTQLVALLSEKANMSDAHVHDDSHSHDSHHDEVSDKLAVWVELHSHRTHVHVKEPGKEMDTFFLDDLSYDEEEAIIEAIAERTGLSEHDIEAVIKFPSGEVDANGDSIADAHHKGEHGDGHHDDEIDLHGIHIMADGTVMLGSGVELHGATVTADGMIMLENGDLVEPEFDLR